MKLFGEFRNRGTSDLRGAGPDKFYIPAELYASHKEIACTAKKMHAPLLLQFNGANWHDADEKSAFQKYWKTYDGGEFLSRYIDGKVNEGISETSDVLPNESLLKFIGTDPYSRDAKNTLNFTNSVFAQTYQMARLKALDLALQHWKKIDDECGHAITALTTDSEVSNFSFRPTFTAKACGKKSRQLFIDVGS